MTRRAVLLACALCLAILESGQAQVVRVASADRVIARAQASTRFGYVALPVSLLAGLGAEVKASGAEVEVRLFGDTLRFRRGHPAFQVNRRMESLHSFPYEEGGELFVAEWFFTRWLPERYPGRLTYRDGVLRIVPRPPVNAGRPVPSNDTALVGPLSSGRQGSGALPRGVLLGFIDARVSGVYDSNIDHEPAARPSFGTVARVGVGLHSARVRPLLLVRYDLAFHRFAQTKEWNHATHDVSVEVAPALRPIRLRLGAALRLGSWTEDRQMANQVILKPQIEIRPAPAHVFSVYALQSLRRIDVGIVTRRDTLRLAGTGYYLWWPGGGFWLDGRYEVNASEDPRSRYAGWTGGGGIHIPLPASLRLTLEGSFHERGYPDSFVDSVARADRRWMTAVALTREFHRTRWELGLGYALEENQSNEPYAVYQARRVAFTVRRRW